MNRKLTNRQANPVVGHRLGNTYTFTLAFKRRRLRNRIARRARRITRHR